VIIESRDNNAIVESVPQRAVTSMSGAFVMSSKTRGGNNDAIEWVVAARANGPINSRKTWTAASPMPWLNLSRCRSYRLLSVRRCGNEECKPKPEIVSGGRIERSEKGILRLRHLRTQDECLRVPGTFPKKSEDCKMGSRWDELRSFFLLF
jgi:hypothetical protein